jgi:ribosomal protein L37AE/L43A
MDDLERMNEAQTREKKIAARDHARKMTASGRRPGICGYCNELGWVRRLPNGLMKCSSCEKVGEPCSESPQ